MLPPYHEVLVRSGNLQIRFLGIELARTSSERLGAVRWSELALYQTVQGEFVLEKIGRSTVAHRPGCRAVTHRMSLSDPAGCAPCLVCQPDIASGDPAHIEPQRYTVHQCANFADVVDILTEGRERPPVVVTRLIVQAADALTATLTA
ncbi:MAG: hypothetical protein ACOYD1_07810 [Candidatus Nanopelagicales bacterium]